MTKDSYSIFQNRGTLQERNQKRKKIVAHILRSEFKKEFKARRLLLGSDQFFTVDLMSDDDEIAVKIVNPCRASYKKISSGKFQNILSSIIILKAISSKRKLLIFTSKKLHENFYSSISSASPVFSDAINGIEIAWIPLSDEFNNYEYSEPNFRINEDGFRQTRRNQE
jgi:hypothetical protein